VEQFNLLFIATRVKIKGIDCIVSAVKFVFVCWLHLKSVAAADVVGVVEFGNNWQFQTSVATFLPN
jgi:hypothetical protein